MQDDALPDLIFVLLLHVPTIPTQMWGAIEYGNAIFHCSDNFDDK